MHAKAYSYLRFSTPEQAHGDSARRQRAMAATYAREHGLLMDDTLTFRDLGVSAYRSRNAKAGALRAFLEAVESGLVPKGSFLLVESLDRISRDQILSAQGLFLQIIEAGVTLVTLMDGRSYSVAGIIASPFDLIISLMTMMRANEESATKGRRLREAWSEKRANALSRPMTAMCPSWLRLDKRTRRFVVRRGQAKILRRVFTDTLSGIGQHGIARALNAEGVPVFGEDGKQGAYWHRSFIAALQRSPAVMGTLVPCTTSYPDGKLQLTKQQPVPGYFPAVIPEADFLAVQAIRERTKAAYVRTVGGQRPTRNVLARLARCPGCGGSMMMTSSGDPNWRYFVCFRANAGAGCSRRSIRYPEVETAVTSRIGELLGARLATAAQPDLMPTARVLGRELHNGSAAPGALGRPRREEAATAASADPLDLVRLNLALRAVLRSVTIDHARRRLLLLWQDGAIGELPAVWPP